MSATHREADQIVSKFESLYRGYYREEIGRLAQRYPDGQRSLEVGWHDIYRFDAKLAEDFVAQPKRLIDYAEEALRLYDLPVDIDLANAHVRVANLPDSDTFAVGDYRTDQQGEYVALSGQVSRRTTVKPKADVAAYECQRCGTITEIPQVDGAQEPHECQGCERQGPFQVNYDRSEFVDFQVIRLQRPPEDAKGGTTTTIDVQLEDDITGEIEAGDRLDAAGVLQMRPADDEDNPTFDYYLDAKAIEPKETSYEDIEIQPHLEEIRDLAADDPFEYLTNAIAPKVYGYDHIKESIILQLFGGVRAEYPDGSADRGSIHILLLGDPGVAKSKLLRAANELSPRSTFASGKGSSAAGLTAGVKSDDFGNQRFSLQAGALVTANEGLACIDELDKVDEETRSSLHTALEQQVVEVNKIIEASMPARTALLAAGNPKYGRFDKHESIADQITLGPALMSRFDLMYMMHDDVEPEKDEEIADHIIDTNQEAIRHTVNGGGGDAELIDPDVDQDVIRAYVAYARQNVYPTIEDQAVKKEIRDNFVGLREMGQDDDAPVPVTFRKLEAVLRLAQASARVRLSDTIEVEDVNRAQKLIGKSMQDVGVDPDTGQLDADAIETGQTKNQRDRKKKVKSIIEELAEEYEKGAPEEAIIEMAEEHGAEASTVRNDIQDFREKGDIYSPKEEGHWKVT